MTSMDVPWRRLAAAWVDAFVVYAVVAFLVAATAPARIRLAFEPVYVVVAAAYGVALSIRDRQTIGKLLLGIAVRSRPDGTLRLREALLREVLGKWGLAVVLPITLGRILVGRAWVPTVYDFATLLPVALLLGVPQWITRRTWYDRLAGTMVVRERGPRARDGLAFAALAGAAVLALGAKSWEFAALGRLPCRLALHRSMRSTEAYVSFLEQARVAPVDYVIGLFDRHDVVVLCERLHPEASQWEFILEIVSDPRFSERVGHVFTEYGQVALQPYLDDFMATNGLSEREVHERAIHVMRHWAVWPAWNNTNFHDYLTRLYELNQALPPGDRIQHHFTDMPVDWAGLTRAQYQAYWRSLADRDEYMARCVIEEMARLSGRAGSPPRCLVVMNYRHAFDLTGRAPDAPRHNTFEYLEDAFGDRAANVLLNTSILLYAPIAGGLWDAAFAETENRTAGFDFAGSPFGADPFDLFPFLPGVRGRLDYRDVFTGFVFAQPLEHQFLQHGIPGYFEGFEDEMMRRAALVSEDYQRRIEILIGEEEQGRAGEKEELPDTFIESCIELGVLAVAGVGLWIGTAAFILGRLRGPQPASAPRPGASPG